MKLQQLLKEMTIDFVEKGLEWAGKTLDDIFHPTKTTDSKQKKLTMAQEKSEAAAADQKVEDDVVMVIELHFHIF